MYNSRQPTQCNSSGEMRDTAQLGPLSSYMTNALMPLEDRARLFRTWASVLAMMPTGGEKVRGGRGPAGGREVGGS